MASERVVEGKGLYAWLDRRFPITPLLKNHLAEYYAPKNLNFWYFFWEPRNCSFGVTNLDGNILSHALQT